MEVKYSQKSYCYRPESYYEDGTFYEVNDIPEIVTIKPTLKCSARCTHCEGRLKDFTNKEVLKLEEYEKLFSDLKEMGTKVICISGGEPLLYKDLDKLVEMAFVKGLVVTVNTNGLLMTNKRLRELLNAGVFGINLSLDSPIGNVHDNLRNLDGLFDRVIQNFKDAKKIGIHFNLNVRMVLSKYNFRDIQKMIDLVRELDADVLSIDMMENDHENKIFLLSKQQIIEFNHKIKPEISDKLNKIFLDNDTLKINALRNIENILSKQINSYENYEIGIYWPDKRIKEKCAIPHSFMIVEGDGSVLPCNAVEYTRNPIIGNVKENSIKKIWKSDEWETFRNEKIEFCLKCPMNASCMILFNDKAVVRDTEQYV